MNTTATGITVPAHRPMTAAQSAYIRDLLAKVTAPTTAQPIRSALNTHRDRGTLTIEVASMAITSLKALIAAQDAAPSPALAVVVPSPAPAPAPARQAYPVVSEGRYAVEMDGVLRFYFVSKYAGGTRTSVKRYVSDTLVRVNAGEQVRVLRLIEADEQAARETYARETTRCWTCGRRLTDPESIAAGQGPDCRGR